MLHIPGGDNIFFCCKSCPYRHPIQSEVRFPLKLQTKAADDILGGAEAWDNVDKTEVQCPKCNNDEAFWFALQIRSADEPSTIFYRCTNFDCQHRWKD